MDYELTNVDFQRKMLESTYDGVLSVFRHVQSTKESGESVQSLKKVWEDIPCGLSKRFFKNSDTYDFAREKFEGVLFLSPEIKIFGGDVITVKQYKEETTFVNTTPPFLYPTHQEVYINQEDIKL